MYRPRPLRFVGYLIAVLAIFLVAAVAYSAGASSSGAPSGWPYAVHGAFFLFGPLFFFLFVIPLCFMAFFGFSRLLMGGHHHGHWHGDGSDGHPHADHRRAMLDEWHREAHAAQPGPGPGSRPE